MSPRNRSHGGNTRQAVLEAAIRKFGEKSFLTATTIEIASDANVSEKTIFDLFGDKKNLYLQACERIRSETFAEMLPRLPIGSGAPDVLRALGREFLRDVMRDKDRLRVSIQAITAIDDDEIKKNMQQYFLDVMRFVRTIIVNGQASGLVREDIDVDQFAWTCCMAMQSVGYMSLMDQAEAIDDESALVLWNRLIDRIRPIH